MLVCGFVLYDRTRDRGCSAHPVFPAPSEFLWGQGLWGQGFQQNAGRTAPRECEGVCEGAVIARSPCDEAIHSSSLLRDGLLRFARNDGEGPDQNPPK